MKRFCVFVIALFCALTASAADSAINRVTLDGAAVTVNVTAETDCALTAVLYDAAGRLLGVQTREVGATAGRDVSVTMPDGIPAGSVAKAFLTGADNKPVCKAVASSDSGVGGGDTPATDGVYAILYADGTLVFQHGNTPQAGREVRKVYAVDNSRESYTPYSTPWDDEKAFIYQVEFADLIQPERTASWFYKCTKLKEIKNIENLDTVNVTDMHHMFYGCGLLETLDVSHFDTTNVTNMSSMFRSCGLLATLDVSHFDTANVTSMGSMFYGCGRLTTLDVSSFNTANVTNMGYMFSGCGALTALDVSDFNTANVTNMSYMFYGCSALATLDVSDFNTANVTNMDEMFRDCMALTMLDVSNFDTINVTYMRWMFANCYGLITIYASGQFVISQVTNSGYMFFNCDLLVGGNGTTYDSEHTDVEYARIDGGASAPGYFTAK